MKVIRIGGEDETGSRDFQIFFSFFPSKLHSGLFHEKGFCKPNKIFFQNMKFHRWSWMCHTDGQLVRMPYRVVL